MAAILKHRQGWLRETRHTKPRLSQRELYWKVWSSLVGERSPQVYWFLPLSGLSLSFSGFTSTSFWWWWVGLSLIHYSLNKASSTFFSTYQFMCFLAHVAECGYCRTPGRFFLFWYNRNMVISISIPGSRNRCAQLNQWHMVSFSSSQTYQWETGTHCCRAHPKSTRRQEWLTFLGVLINKMSKVVFSSCPWGLDEVMTPPYQALYTFWYITLLPAPQ